MSQNWVDTGAPGCYNRHMTKAVADGASEEKEGKERRNLGSERNTYRYRFSVPDKDTIVREWIAAQDHLSMSLRLLIKEDVMQHGLADVTCRLLSGMGAEPPRPKKPRQAQSEGPARDRVPAARVSREEPAIDPDEGSEGRTEPKAAEAPRGRPVQSRPQRQPREVPPPRTDTPAKDMAGTVGEEPVAKTPEAQPRQAEPPAKEPVTERPPAPQAPPADAGDPMAFLDQTAGSAGGMMDMLGMDDDDED